MSKAISKRASNSYLKSTCIMILYCACMYTITVHTHYCTCTCIPVYMYKHVQLVHYRLTAANFNVQSLPTCVRIYSCTCNFSNSRWVCSLLIAHTGHENMHLGFFYFMDLILCFANQPHYGIIILTSKLHAQPYCIINDISVNHIISSTYACTLY